MNKKVIALVVAVVFTLGAFAPVVSAQPNELEIWVSSGDEEDWMNDMADAYEAQTGIEIEVTTVGEVDQMEQLSLDGPAGHGPDVVGYPHDMLGQSVLQGLLEPIEDYLPDGYATENYLDESIDALTHEGTLYGLPYDYQSVALVYNKNWYSEAPETFAELLDQAEEMTGDNEYGFLFDIQNFYYSYAFFGGYGGYVFGEQGGEVDVYDIGLANEGSIKAGEFLKQFRDRGIIPQGVEYDNLVGLFEQGDVGAIIDGPWSMAGYLDEDTPISADDIGVAPLPKLPNGNRPETFMGVKGYYLSQYSEHKEAAAEFIKFLTDAERSMDHYQSNNIMVPHVAVLESEELANDQYLQGFARQAELNSTPMPSVAEMGQVWDPMENAVTFILRGEAPPEQALPMVVDQIENGIRNMQQ